MGIVIVAALLWFFGAQLSKLSFDWKLVGHSFTRVRWEWVLLALIPILGTYWGRALRWAVFLRPLKPHPSLRNLFAATVIGFTAIALFGRPGEFVRPYLIARKENVPVPSQIAAWVLERIFDLLMALLLFAFALSRVQSSGMQVGGKLAWVLAAGGRIVGVLCIAIFAILLSLRHFAEPFRRRLLGWVGHLPAKRVISVTKLLNALFQGVESMRSDTALLLVFLYSVVEWVLICLCYWCLARSFTDVLNFTFVDVLILMGFLSFGAVVQIPGVGGGMQVVAVLVLTELFAVRFEVASTFAMFLWFITFVAIVPLGLFMAVKEGLGWHGLKRLGQEARE